MNTIRKFLALAPLLAGLALPGFASSAAAAPARVHEQALVGIWQDDHDPENIIQFYPNHAVRIYVPKSDGQARDVHWIEGTWALSRHDLMLTLNMPSNGGMSRIRKFTVEFAGKKLVVKEDGQVVGRQHRITETALKKHLW